MTASALSEEQAQYLRNTLEQEFQQNTGLAFKDFRCEAPVTWPQSREFTCNATDTEDDSLIYRFSFNRVGSEPTYKVFQPVGQLNQSELKKITQPVDTFLDAFSQKDWSTAYGMLSSDFQQQYSLKQFTAALVPMSQTYGAVSSAEAKLYTAPEPGLHQLEYDLKTASGIGIGRFGLRLDSSNQARIVSFLLSAQPGSDIYQSMILEAATSSLARFFNQPIEKSEADLAELKHLGDEALGKLFLQNGREIIFRIEQTGIAYDLDRNDFNFQLLDAKTLIGLHLASINLSASKIDCPQSIAPDNGELRCEATFSDGTTRSYNLMRRGGDHRLVEVE